MADSILAAENAELRRRLEEAEETLRAIRDGAVDAFVVTEDSVDRVYTLEGADRPYRLLVEQMQQGAAMLYADGSIAYSNLRLADMLGVSHTQLLGRALRSFIAPEADARFRDLLHQGEIETGDGEIVLQRADGVQLPVYLTVNVLPPDSGAALGVLMTDLTDVRDLQELKRARAALERADRRKDEFLAILAHELRGPLAPVRNSIEIMKRAEGDAALIDRARLTIDRQITQMERLVDDLLDISRITSDKLELRKAPVDLAEVLNLAVESCRPLSVQAQHRIRLSLPPERLVLDADPVRLGQIFFNLVNNACKYTEPGGHIDVIAERAGGQAIVKVRDNGVGIPPEKLAGIFEMFSQVDKSQERSHGGLGLGLALVQRLVEMHGGKVSASSAGPGRGSEFVVHLPLPAADAPVAQEAPSRSEAPVRPRRILVVDDNRDSADTLSMLLSLAGHETETAHDGLEAIEAAQAFRPDIALLDIGMPRLNGRDAARRIRAQPWGKDMVLVALTGWGQDEDRIQSQDAGFDLHMTKPVDYEVFADLIASLERKPV